MLLVPFENVIQVLVDGKIQYLEATIMEMVDAGELTIAEVDA